jgi:hypothetical protein
MLDLKVAVFHPSKSFESLPKRRDAGLHFRIVLGRCMQEHDAPYPYPLGLLRARRERPCGRRAAEQRDELAPLHSITSSPRASSLSGITRFSPLAALRLITNSNLVGCITGRLDGLAPFRIFPAYNPIWLNASERGVP